MILNVRCMGNFADGIFKCIFLNENALSSLKISSFKFLPKFRINNIPALVQIMACHWPGDKPLSEPMMVNLRTHMCVTRPHWVKEENEEGLKLPAPSQCREIIEMHIYHMYMYFMLVQNNSALKSVHRPPDVTSMSNLRSTWYHSPKILYRWSCDSTLPTANTHRIPSFRADK